MLDGDLDARFLLCRRLVARSLCRFRFECATKLDFLLTGKIPQFFSEVFNYVQQPVVIHKQRLAGDWYVDAFQQVVLYNSKQIHLLRRDPAC